MYGLRKTANVASMQSCVVESHYEDKAIASVAFGLGSKPVAFTSEPYKHNVVYKVPATSGFAHHVRKRVIRCFLKRSVKSERFGQILPLVTS